MTREEFERWIKEYAPAAAAMRKIDRKLNPNWYPFGYEAAHGGMLIKGCAMREATKGANKGQMIQPRGEFVDTVVVSRAEIDREQRRIEKVQEVSKAHAKVTERFKKVVQKNLERARKLPRFSKVERTETTFFGVYRNHTFDLRQEGPRNWWYIRVTAPCGSYDYDGWWKDSEDKTVDDAILEAMAGAGMELPAGRGK